MTSLVVVGSLNVDLSIRVPRHPAPGETLLGRSLKMLPGGKGANQALAAARLGAPTTMVGAVGDDPQAEIALRLLREAGADLTHILQVPGPTGLARVEVDDAGENTIVVIPGANESVTAAALRPALGTIAAADVVVLQGEIPASGIAAAAGAATGRVVLNLAPVVELPAETILRADPLVVNEHEGRLVLAQLGGPAAAAEAPEQVIRALHRAGVRSVIMTLGGAGALILGATPAQESLLHIAAPVVTVADTTGAGDAFTGALAARLAAGDPLDRAAAYAVRVGSYTVQREGAQNSYPGSASPLPELPEPPEAGREETSN